MKRVLRNVSPWFSFVLGALVVVTFGVSAMRSGSAHAAEPERAILPDDPACVGKFKGEICSLPDTTGGFCVPSRCGQNDRPCLRCRPSTPESVGLETMWAPMLAFGMVVTVIGGIFWLRLKRNWNKGEEENKRR